jgi:hypothetical protein
MLLLTYEQKSNHIIRRDIMFERAKGRQQVEGSSVSKPALPEDSTVGGNPYDGRKTLALGAVCGLAFYLGTAAAMNAKFATALVSLPALSVLAAAIVCSVAALLIQHSIYSERENARPPL